MDLQTAIFGGGCFWCTEAIFQRLKGVTSVMSGYSGGDLPNPTYEQVSSGNTGHVESLKIEFDPNQISFKDLLNVFFATHDPTQINQQGNDVGEQYQSTVFYVDDEQKFQAEKFIQQLESEHIFDKAISTRVKKFNKFYGAESYHQNYYNNNQSQPYCQVVINPKLQKLKARFASLLK
jgi:peptide-methionine (S)-S-oxide reductase